MGPRLDQQAVRAFVNELERRANDPDPGAIGPWFGAHLADAGRFSTAMHYTLPGQAAKDSVLAMDKTHYISALTAGAGTMRDYTGNVQVLSVMIAADGRSADVRTLTHETGTLVTNAAAGHAMGMRGQSECVETVILAGNALQLKNADCNTVIDVTNTAAR